MRTALCKSLLLAPASCNCSLAVPGQQIICVMDFLSGMCKNSAFWTGRTEFMYENRSTKVIPVVKALWNRESFEAFEAFSSAFIDLCLLILLGNLWEALLSTQLLQT